MAEKNPLVNKAYELYKQGMKLIDIANQLGKPAGTIRRWKSTYGWDSERSDKKSERSPKKKKGKKAVSDDGTKATLQNNDLTPEQQMFCVFYIKSFNATQSYMKAFNCSYDVANAHGFQLLSNVVIREEINRLKEIKRQNIVCNADDLVELNMRIAFADMGDYASFEGNNVSLKDSAATDTQLIQKVKSGKSGISIELADRYKAMDWLTKYFVMNPMDRHRREFDRHRLELEMLKLDAQVKENESPAEAQDNNFLQMLSTTGKESWKNDGLEQIRGTEEEAEGEAGETEDAE